MWFELNWILREDPNEDFALASLDRIVSDWHNEPLVSLVPSSVRESGPLDAVDVDAILDDVRVRALHRAGVPPVESPDALHAYLEGLDRRESSPLLLVR